LKLANRLPTKTPTAPPMRFARFFIYSPHANCPEGNDRRLLSPRRCNLCAANVKLIIRAWRDMLVK
jgi:hypothetical protein